MLASTLTRLAGQVRLAGVLTVLLLGVSALAVLVGFDALFRQFHVISFANDLWKLSPARDHLIQMYPRGFWFDATLERMRVGPSRKVTITLTMVMSPSPT